MKMSINDVISSSVNFVSFKGKWKEGAGVGMVDDEVVVVTGERGVVAT